MDQKKIFSSPIFWLAIGGLGLAYYLYAQKKKAIPAEAPAATPATTPTTIVEESPKNSKATIFDILENALKTTTDGEITVTPGVGLVNPEAVKKSLNGQQYDPLTGEPLSDRYTNRIGA